MKKIAFSLSIFVTASMAGLFCPTEAANPHSGQGVPVNSKLIRVLFGQFGEVQSCTVQTSDINNVIINSRAVGIDHNSPSSSCTEDCNLETR